MTFLKEPDLAPPVDCPYIDGEKFTQEYFYAWQLNEEEWDSYLQTGWRRFGLFFFRPACKGCRRCLPIRVDIKNFTPTKSQRRLIRKNSETEVRLSPPAYSDELYDLYAKHSLVKFGKKSDREDFKESFFRPAVPSFQTMYYLKGKLVAAGFADLSSTALSSVYFVYDPDYSEMSLGNYSVIKEMEIGKEMGLSWYNLGYWIEENKSMNYKSKFVPNEIYDWEQKIWCAPEERD